MQNANIGLVDITLTCHFEVKDAEVFGGAGSVGYTSVALKHAKAADQPQNGGRYDGQYPRVASLPAAPHLNRRTSADTGSSYTTAA